MYLIADIVITIITALLSIALIAAAASKFLSLRKNRSASTLNGIPAKRITWTVTAFTILLLAITFLALPADTLIVNGKDFDDTLMLRLTGMCVTSSIVLLIAASISLCFGYFRKK